ncbi:MAG: ABC-2 family transporter protein [Oligoflexia bacterium]|nr:ABC-2 family transporter protein [Oligoflexia bacterium]
MSGAQATRLGWVPHVFSLELRKLVAYRADFWAGFLGSLVATLGIAYFLWQAIFEERGGTVIGGYTFHGMMLYYLVVALVAKVVQAQELGVLAQDIYQGTLNRYLVYPVPFFVYKFIETFAHAALFSLQLVLTVGLFALLFGLPPTHGITPTTVLAGLVTALLAGYLYYSLTVLIELSAFWADNVWSLLVMLRLSTSLLGGALLPLSLFPEGAREALSWLPFEYLFSFPARTFLGELGLAEWLRSAGMLVIWAILSSLAIRLLWRRGLRQYTGVGI